MKKIAFITDDGNRLSSHFGSAPYFHIFTIEDGKITDKEVREKPAKAHHDHGHEHHRHGQDGDGHQNHLHRNIGLISDCHVLIAGGMCIHSYQNVIDQGLEVVMVGGEIEDALALYIDGQLNSDMRRIHKH